MKNIIAILLVLFVSTISGTQAQEIISTNGSYDEFSGGSINWTMGEPIIETLSNGSNDLTQGFQQTDLNVITSIPSFAACQGDVVVPVNIQNISNVASFSISLGYNVGELAYNHYQNVNPALAGGNLSVVPGGGVVTISWSSATPVSIGNAALLEISFSASLAPVITNLSWNTAGGNSQYMDLSNEIFPAAFVDATLTIQPLPAADAGEDVSICIGESYNVMDASASNSSSLLWTGGLGTIAGETSLNPTYKPAPGESGAVILTLTAEPVDPCTVSATSEKTIFIQASPSAYAGQDASILPAETHVLTDATADNYNSLLWETSGDGIFIAVTDLNPEYFPGANDKLAGFVELSLTAQPISPCVIADADQMGLTIYRPPTVQILSPSEGDSFYDYDIVVDGSADDPDGDLTEVYVNLNNGGWELAAGLNNWTKNVTLVVGDNLIQAQSVDAQGLLSEIAQVNVFAGIQIIPIAQGWSAISSFLEPLDPAVDVMMQDVNIPDKLAIMLSSVGIYWPAYNSNTIGLWNTLEGYKVKYLTDVVLTVRGNKLADNSAVFGAGFHIIPVLSNVPSPIVQIFTDPLNDVNYLFDMASGQIFWPGGGLFDLVELTPGRGYLANFDAEVTIDFPDFSTLKSGAISNAPVTRMNGPWEISHTGNVHVISINNAAATELKEVTHLGAFDANGFCVGYTEVNHTGNNYLLTLFGDDETTSAKDGALEEEQLTFIAYNPARNLEYEITPVFSEKMPDVSGDFKTNGMSMIIGFKESSTGIAGSTGNGLQVEMFPNPARDMVTLICPDCTADAQFEAEFVNAGGKLAKKIELTGKSTIIDLDGLNRGVYFVKITSQSGTVIKKLVIQ